MGSQPRRPLFGFSETQKMHGFMTKIGIRLVLELRTSKLGEGSKGLGSRV